MKAQVLCKSLLFAIICVPHLTLGIITTLNRHDPVPPYTVDNPFALLGTNQYEFLKGLSKEYHKQHFALEIMPFYQRATRGGNACGSDAELGDILGRWNMIALLPYNSFTEVDQHPVYTSTNTDLPCGQTHPGILVRTRDQLLTEIHELVALSGSRVPEELKSVQGLLDVQSSNTNTTGNFGFFSVPMSYKKGGVRFNAQIYIGKGFGVDAQTGFADIRQCATFIDQTPTATNGNPFNDLAITAGEPEHADRILTPTWVQICKKVSLILMSQLDQIVTDTEINKSICQYHASSIEDIYAEIFWRRPIRVNDNVKAEEYPQFLFIPYFAVGGSFGVGKNPNPCQLLGLAFGNQCHNSARFRAGLSLDFYETVQVNFEAGGTFFNTRKFTSYPVPTNEFQYPIYPHSTTVCIKPGPNWHMVLGLNAQNFFDKFSFTFNYIFASHQKDHIHLTGNNYAAGEPLTPTVCRQELHPFKPCVLECKSEWTVQVFDAALNYAISPHARIGFMMQIPFKRKNAYRSSTFAASIFASF